MNRVATRAAMTMPAPVVSPSEESAVSVLAGQGDGNGDELRSTTALLSVAAMTLWLSPAATGGTAGLGPTA